MRCNSFHLPLLPSLGVALAIFANTPLGAQGGGYPVIHQFDGGIADGDFGGSVDSLGDIDGDGVDDLVVGAPESGYANVYSGASGNLLHSFTGLPTDWGFGEIVSNAGDMDGDTVADILITATGATVGGTIEVGKAYVYSGATFGQLFEFTGDQGFDYFGVSADSVGDVSGNGFDDVIIGAYAANPGGLGDAGAVYLYEGGTGNLLHTFAGSHSDQMLGYSCARVDDADGDGVADLLLGAPGASFLGFESGSAFLYSGATYTQLFRFDGAGPFHWVGTNVGGGGDFDGDGFGDVICGSSSLNETYLLSGNTGNLIQLIPSYGSAMSHAGDHDGDGLDDFLSGDKKASPNGVIEAGTVTLYSSATGIAIQQIHGFARGDRFGSAVAVGNFELGGQLDFFVGAYRADPSGLTDAGSAYLFGDYSPFIQLNTNEISAAIGGTLFIDLDFPATSAGHSYKTLISGTGTGPVHFGVDIPLSQDPIMMNSASGIYPVPNHSNMHGVLDGTGEASASMDIPAGLSVSLIGRVFWMAAIAHPAGLLPEYSSVAAAITIIP